MGHPIAIVEYDVTSLVSKIKKKLGERQQNSIELGELFHSLKEQVPRGKFRLEVLKLGRTDDQVDWYIKCFQQDRTVDPRVQTTDSKGQKSEVVENSGERPLEELDDIPAKSNFNPAGTRGYENKPAVNLFLRRLMAISACDNTSPFSSVAWDALRECDTVMAKDVVLGIDVAIKRLSEYRKQFGGIRG
jgi:hypothetical protein